MSDKPKIITFFDGLVGIADGEWIDDVETYCVGSKEKDPNNRRHRFKVTSPHTKQCEKCGIVMPWSVDGTKK